jgi:hypothetical protein
VLLLLSTGASGSIAGGPVPTASPSVIGTAAAGKQLTGLSGSWGGFGAITYHFQWYRCNAAGASCLSIHGATSPTFALGVRDIGKTLGLRVSASDSTGSTSAFASLVGPIAPKRPLLESTAQPVATGPPVMGKTVEVTTGTWSPVPANLSYVWERCNANGRACAAIPRATSSLYTIANADLGHALLAVVQASNGPTIQNAFSTSTPAVVGSSVKGPSSTIGPVVSGPTEAGQLLVAATGIWKGVGPVVFTYKWYRCNLAGAACALIAGAKTSNYTPGAKDVGDTIGLTLQVGDSTGAAVAYASLVGPVAAAGATLTPTSAPTISGTARAGGELTVDDGLWSAKSTYSYGWLRCNVNGRLCATIPGATSSTYRPSSADTGHALIALVTATAAGIKQPAFSAATDPIT